MSDRLPAPESKLQRVSSTPPDLRLDSQESKIWKLALGEMSIAKIAEELGLEIDRVRQIGFRLCAIGLVREIAIVSPAPVTVSSIDTVPIVTLPTPSSLGSGHVPAPVSTSFLSKLMGFLTQKV